MQVQKTKQRKVITLQGGTFNAREVPKVCTQDKSHPVMGSAELSLLVKPRQRYAYDLIVSVGLARYLRRKQREEIRAELYHERGIELSDGSISNLCDRFLTHLEALHLARTPQLRTALQAGYPLHIDATCEHGKGGLFVCMDGWRQWVLQAVRIPSEHADYLQPLVERTITLFGEPIATVRDLGDAGAKAVARLREKGIPDLICHYHFLAAVGKKLFDQSYSLLRRLLQCSKVRADMRVLLRELRRYRHATPDEGRFGGGQVREDLLALVLWILEGEGKRDPPYPFSMPHLEFFQRCQQTVFRTECWVASPRTQPERRAIAHLSTLINRLEHDDRFATAVTRLEKGWQAFCELRDVLQLTNTELPRADLRHHQAEIPALEARRLQEIENAVHDCQAQLRQRIIDSDNTVSGNTSPTAVILKYLDRYGERLFGHPTMRDRDGSILAIVERTNNVLEHFFGDEKQRLRRRLGRANLGRDLEDQPAQAALAANLRHPDYVRVLCGSLDNLPWAFADLDTQELANASPLVRNNRDSKLLRRIQTLIKSENSAELVLNG